MADLKVEDFLDKLINGMGSFLSTKTVVGEPIKFGDTIILPLVEVSFGMGAGTGNEDKKTTGAGGIGGKMSPSAVLIISKGGTKLVNVKNQDSVTKILDMVPDLINRFTEPREGAPEVTDTQAIDIAFDKTESSGA
ncbi:MAG: GerW family sporulation protein [Lachnospiraceae bacterium]|nr:GerW family sporulation protein [Lachnospiraceae bacterium]